MPLITDISAEFKKDGPVICRTLDTEDFHKDIQTEKAQASWAGAHFPWDNSPVHNVDRWKKIFLKSLGLFNYYRYFQKPFFNSCFAAIMDSKKLNIPIQVWANKKPPMPIFLAPYNSRINIREFSRFCAKPFSKPI